MQRAINWTKPDELDLEKLDTEVLTNYTAFLHLTKAFLRTYRSKSPKRLRSSSRPLAWPSCQY